MLPHRFSIYGWKNYYNYGLRSNEIYPHHFNEALVRISVSCFAILLGAEGASHEKEEIQQNFNSVFKHETMNEIYDFYIHTCLYLWVHKLHFSTNNLKCPFSCMHYFYFVVSIDMGKCAWNCRHLTCNLVIITPSRRIQNKLYKAISTIIGKMLMHIYCSCILQRLFF